MGWLILFVIIALGVGYGAFVMYDNKQDRLQREQRRRAAEEAKAQELQRYQEERDRQAAQDQIRRETEERASRESQREARINEGVFITERSVDLVEQIYSQTIAAVRSQRDTEIYLAQPRYHPFWDSAYETFGCMEKVEYYLQMITEYASEYYVIACEHPGRLPPFVDLDGLEQVPPVIDAVRQRLELVVDQAHGIEGFSHAYGTLRLESAIKQGFDQLNAKLNRIERSIHLNTVVVSQQLSSVTSQLEAMQRSTDNATQVLANTLAGAQRDIAEGLRHATAARNSDYRAAQQRADKVLSEIRQIKRAI